MDMEHEENPPGKVDCTDLSPPQRESTHHLDSLVVKMGSLDVELRLVRKIQKSTSRFSLRIVSLDPPQIRVGQP